MMRVAVAWKYAHGTYNVMVFQEILRRPRHWSQAGEYINTRYQKQGIDRIIRHEKICKTKCNWWKNVIEMNVKQETRVEMFAIGPAPMRQQSFKAPQFTSEIIGVNPCRVSTSEDWGNGVFGDTRRSQHSRKAGSLTYRAAGTGVAILCKENTCPDNERTSARGEVNWSTELTCSVRK
jgi:hypothetical protein